MTFKDIIGQEQIVKHMKGAISQNKVNHAYIICGEKGSGKKLLAQTFAAAIQCELGEAEPCMQCKSCRQAMSGNHPDIKYVQHDKPSVIGVDDIRTQLVSDVSIKPYASRKKIYIVDEAEKMNQQAQNAMLKTFEEPPEYAVIILLVTNANILLSTIRSRSVILNVRAVSKDKIVKILQEQSGASQYMAEVAAAFSDGVVGRAKEFAASDEFAEIKSEVLRSVSGIDEASAAELYAMVKGWAADKNRIDEKLNLLEMWYRDVMVLKATDDTGAVLFREEISPLYKQCDAFTYEDLMKKADAIRVFRERLKLNVNLESALMVLFLALRDKTE